MALFFVSGVFADLCRSGNDKSLTIKIKNNK